MEIAKKAKLEREREVESEKINYAETIEGKNGSENEQKIKIEEEEALSFDPQRSQYMAQHLATTQTEAYNPDQDREEVLQIRKKYSELREELDKNRRELVKADSEKLSVLIDEANLVFSRVHTTSDASLDSRFISDAADFGALKVHRLPLFVSEFSLDTFLRISQNYLEHCTWNDLGKLVGTYWQGVETLDYMLGPMDLQIKGKTPRMTPIIRAPRAEVAPLVKPTIVNLMKNNEENNSTELNKETSENVMKVFGVLAEIGSVPFYHFITDPESFARTVENLFYVSFLVRDNRARLLIPEFLEGTSNELYIEAVFADDDDDDDDNEERDESQSSDLHQMVMGMTSKIWRRSIEKYKIEKPFLVL